MILISLNSVDRLLPGGPHLLGPRPGAPRPPGRAGRHHRRRAGPHHPGYVRLGSVSIRSNSSGSSVGFGVTVTAASLASALAAKGIIVAGFAKGAALGSLYNSLNSAAGDGSTYAERFYSGKKI